MHRLTNGTKQVYLGWRRLRHGCSGFDVQLERLKYATTIHQRRHEAIVIQRDHHFTEQRVPREPVRNRRYRQPCPVSSSSQIFVTSRSVSARPREPVKPEYASQLSHTPCPEFSREPFSGATEYEWVLDTVKPVRCLRWNRLPRQVPNSFRTGRPRRRYRHVRGTKSVVRSNRYSWVFTRCSSGTGNNRNPVPLSPRQVHVLSPSRTGQAVTVTIHPGILQKNWTRPFTGAFLSVLL